MCELFALNPNKKDLAQIAAKCFGKIEKLLN